ncbi:MAG TPA: protein kinase, partial [Candidatus Melainabacteria bacterium]|nr:protein kinase [Candidatus Melainabacteria bacterium]
MNSISLPDRYEILCELGSGGMGKVYLALDTTLQKSVAIKVLTTDSLENDPEKLQRFQREAKAAGRMRHENLVSVMDFGLTPSGKPYLV